MVLTAIALCNWWLLAAACYVFSMNSGTKWLRTTTLLSQKTLQGPRTMSMLPIIQRLFLKLSMILIAIYIATNLEPKVADSTVICHNENQRSGDLVFRWKPCVWSPHHVAAPCMADPRLQSTTWQQIYRKAVIYQPEGIASSLSLPDIEFGLLFCHGESVTMVV